MPKLNSSHKLIFLLVFLFFPALSPVRADSLGPAQISQTEKIVLDNDLTLLLKKVPGDIASIIVLIKSGSTKEGKFLGSGISHLLEHMLFKDNPENPKSEVAKFISSLGGEITGSTSYETTTYVINLPKQNLNKALELLNTFLFQPQFSQTDLEKEKQVIIKEINLGKDNPSKVLWDSIMETVFTKHPLRYPIIGYENLLKNITLADLNEYYNQEYIGANIVLSIAGDFDNRLVVDKIKELFSKTKRDIVQPAYEITEPAQTSPRENLRSIKTTNLAYGAIAFPSVSINHPDLYALDALAAILSGTRSSRLNQKLKEELQLVYAISASNYTPSCPGLFVITFTGEPKKQEQSFKTILNEIEKLKKIGVANEELKNAKQSIKSEILFAQEYCQNLAESAAEYESMVGDPDFDKIYLERINKLTIRDIQNVAKKYLDVYRISQVSLLQPSHDEKANATSGISTSEKAQIKKINLDNGLRVLLLEDKRLPIINLKVAFLGGLLSENKENNGISNLTSRLLVKGTKTKTAYEISRLIDSWGANLTSFSGNNSFGISINTLKENLPDTLRLIYEIITSPAFDPGEIEKEKLIIFSLLKKQQEDIFTIGSLLLKKELYKDHQYGLNELGRIETVSRLTRENLMDFYQQHISANNMVISVFGYIDSDNTLEIIRGLFSRLPSDNRPSLKEKTLKPLKEKLTQFQILEKEQSLFMLGFSTCKIIDPDRYALDIISEALSNIDGRLFKNIRSKLGIAYALGARNVEMLKGGYFIFYVATTEENLEKAQAKIWEEIENLKKYSISSEELDRAKKSLIGKQKISLQSINSLSWQASLDELYGLGFSNYSSFEDEINRITLQDIKKILNKYFSDNYVEIFISPSSLKTSRMNLPDKLKSFLKKITSAVENVD
ncbi:MAG: pitrilysin family protein [Candidatus Omnitrophota bacterium]